MLITENAKNFLYETITSLKLYNGKYFILHTKDPIIDENFVQSTTFMGYPIDTNDRVPDGCILLVGLTNNFEICCIQIIDVDKLENSS